VEEVKSNVSTTENEARTASAGCSFVVDRAELARKSFGTVLRKIQSRQERPGQEATSTTFTSHRESGLSAEILCLSLEQMPAVLHARTYHVRMPLPVPFSFVCVLRCGKALHWRFRCSCVKRGKIVSTMRKHVERNKDPQQVLFVALDAASI